MKRKPVIAIAGFQHETNTYAPHKAHYNDFVKADGWPGLTQGDAVFDVFEDLNIPISGCIQAAHKAAFNIRPILWASAEPSSFVTESAFETIAGMICDAIKNWDDLDGVYLDLHGAMVTEHFEDGEGELLRRVRSIIGEDMPLVISLDLHANVTEQMVDHATAMTIFRTYPHLDMAETGVRAFDLLKAAISGVEFKSTMRKIPFLIPLTSQCTDMEPCRSIYQRLPFLTESISGPGNIDFATGFPAADIEACGAAIVVSGDRQDQIHQSADQLYQQILEAESDFDNRLYSPDEAVIEAMSSTADKPVVMADAQDNPGAGGTSDTTDLLAALVRNKAKAAVIGVIYDPDVAALAHSVGVGKPIEVSLGAKSGFAGSLPFHHRFIVEAVADGNFVLTGDMYKNSHACLGPMALLRVENDEVDVRIIIGTERVQCLDLAIFRHLDVEPTQQRILAVKSSVHFRADFEPIAGKILVVAAHGANVCDLEKQRYKHLRRGVRLGPGGPVN